MSNSSTTTSGSTDTGPDGPEFDRMFDALGHADRRHVLVTIAEAELADEDRLLLQELETERTNPNRHTVSLVHRHLPKLAEAGYIEWDRETETITRGPNYDAVGALLQLIQDHSDELPGDWSL